MQSGKLKRVALRLLTVLLLLPAATLAQKGRPAAGPPALPAPPGTVRVAENLFADETEVENIHWLEYLQRIARDSTQAFYSSQLPDSTVWRPVPVIGQRQLLQSYFRAPAYYYFPAAGLSYEQALAYCRWRSAVVNRNYFQGTEFRKQHPELRDYQVTVEYRLPTEAEWQLAAAGPAGSTSRPEEIVPGRSKNKRPAVSVRREAGLDSCVAALALPRNEPIYKLPYNLAENYCIGQIERPFTCTSKSNGLALKFNYAYPPTAFGLFNLIGNVAEMTATKGVAKGGSFRTSVQGLKPESRQLYQGPQSWLGFRCVATVRLLPKAGR